MSTFFLLCAFVSALPMVLVRDPAHAIFLAINPFFWATCASLS